MGLLSIIRKQKEKDSEIRVLVLGLDNSGKTTIIRKLMGCDTQSVAPTMGFQIHTFAWQDFHINAWDIGGQLTLRSFWGNYFDSVDVVVWVVDGTSVERLHELYDELRSKVVQQEQLAGTYFCVAINKTDLVADLQLALVRHSVEASLRLLAEIPADRYTVKCVSGRDGRGLVELMEWITSKFQAP
ncbi:ARF/SAR superfamily [Metschnikowia bicuspidata var. bicuspidata NRRL YB-4993]|uniref:ARF/SAR superfamily n=1 Tax=Metschnikowia bicuspidata var. bicuspidata NRRL YB-4993 TaxID=869754 RepID=A0A1A0H8Y7_9ASCO|nr:ARF/SAR superfamily [Metschnikowia bicuspidata var. bicuspidata NRRL YB-4993]OBA20343.1 ARF/SAR superfamily [Metschnikowia bicuspidata var. bicuspidata NRRL YB-4993]